MHPDGELTTPVTPHRKEAYPPAIVIANALVLLVVSASSVSQAWKVPVGTWSGAPPLLAASGDAVLFDAYTDLRLVRVSDGALVRKIAKGACLGAAIDLKIEDGMALVLCESPRGEGSGASELHSTLVAIDLKSGKTRWSREGAIPAPIGVMGALVLFVDGERVIAVDLSMGKSVWSGKAPKAKLGLGFGGAIAAVAAESALIAVSLNDGSPKWSAPLAGWPQAAPVVNADSVFVVHDPATGDAKRRKAEGNRLTAFASADGKVRWKRDFKGESLFFQPVISGELLLVVSVGEEVTDGHLYALKLATGEPAWRVPWSSDANGHDFRPIAMGEVMLAWAAVPKPLGAYELFAFDPTSGAVKWSFAPKTDEKFVFSRPVPLGTKIIYGDGESVRSLVIKPGK